MTAVAIIHRDNILSDLSAGKRLSDIAPTLGVSPQAISRALHADQEYRDAIEQGFSKRIDQAEDAILEAVDAVDVTRARAYWGAISWRAEREHAGKWGNKQVAIQINQISADSSVIDSIADILKTVASVRETVVRNVVTSDIADADIVDNQ